MRILAFTIGAAMLLATTGCAEVFGTRFDGTWLLALDMDYETSAGCDDAWGYTGISNQMVDVYTGADDSIVVMFEQLLQGTFTGSTYEASWLEEWGYDDYLEVDRITMDGVVSSKVMTGSIEVFESWEDADDSEACTITYTYAADKVVSSDSDYVGG